MTMKLEKVVPFGRSLNEYKGMFALSASDLDKAIIGVGDGPASFNAEMFALSKSVISIDPLYVFRANDIETQFDAVVDDIVAQIKATPDDWVWSYHSSPEHLKENRIRVLRRFAADYETGKAEGRYLVGELPRLDFESDRFELAVCSHFLFLYSDHFSYEFHVDSVREMLRVAAEVRIFPLMTLMREKSPYVEALVESLRTDGFAASLEKVGYELQKGGNEMLRMQKRSLTTPSTRTGLVNAPTTR
jgi:hypothetical protein